jgi:hypothetical protein
MPTVADDLIYPGVRAWIEFKIASAVNLFAMGFDFLYNPVFIGMDMVNDAPVFEDGNFFADPNRSLRIQWIETGKINASYTQTGNSPGVNGDGTLFRVGIIPKQAGEMIATISNIRALHAEVDPDTGNLKLAEGSAENRPIVISESLTEFTISFVVRSR